MSFYSILLVSHGTVVDPENIAQSTSGTQTSESVSLSAGELKQKQL